MSTTTTTTGPSFAKTAQPFVCGGLAASFASCIIHPIDLAKVCDVHVVYAMHRSSHP